MKKISITGRRLADIFLILAPLAVMLAGVVILVGWIAGLDWLTTTRHGVAGMRPHSTLAFILSGAALLLQQTKNRKLYRVSQAGVLGITVIALFTFWEYFTGWCPQFEWFFTHPPAANFTNMTPAAALLFFFAAIGLGWSSRRSWNTHPHLAPGYFGLLVLVSGVIAAVGQSGDLRVWHVWWNPMGIPPYSALTFSVLGLAMFTHAWKKTFYPWQISPGLTAGFLAGLALLVGVAADSYRSTNQLIEASNQVRRTLTSIAQIRQLEQLIAAEKYDLRGYVLTGDPDLLQSYSRLFPLAQSVLRELRTQTHHPQQLLDALETQIRTRHEQYQTLIETYKTSGYRGLSGSQALGAIDAGDYEIGATLRSITEQEARLLASEEQTASQATTRTYSVLPVGVLLSVLMLILALLLLNKEGNRKRHEVELRRQNEERLRLALSAAQMGTWDVDLTAPEPERQPIIYSEQTGVIVGAPPHSSVATLEYWSQHIHPEDRARVMAAFKAAVESDVLYSADFRLVHANGEPVQWLSSRGAVLRDAAGRPVRAVGVIMDISDRKKAEIALQEKDLQMRLATEGGALGLWDWNVSTGRLVVTARWLAMLGLDPQLEPTMELWYSLVHPDDLSKLAQIISQVITPESGRNFEAEIRVRHHEGHYIWILDRGAVVARAPDGSPQRVAGTHMEITARKQAEENLQKLNAELEQRVADSTRELRETNAALINFKAALDEHAIVAITDAQGRIIYANDNFCAISKYSREELLGQDHRLINSGYHPKAFFRELWQTITRGRVWKGEIRNRAKDGTIYWVTTTIVPFIGQGGKPTQYIAIRNDITKRIKAEENIRLLNADLETRAIKLEEANRELEAFSYSVSHDLRAPLRAVDGFSRMLFEDYATSLDSEGQRMLKVIRREAQRMGQLIDDLLAFSHISRQQTDPVEIDMRAMVQDVFNELIAREPDRSLNLKLAALPPAFGTPAMIRQVWTNLIGNAIKFTRKRDPGIIEIGAQTDDTGTPVYFIKDNGAGFGMRHSEKLFGVFQRLHAQPEFEGTGVGLALVKRIIMRHGGRVWAESVVGEGAQFFFFLPFNPQIQAEQPSPDKIHPEPREDTQV